jgi:hypothetical protein
MARYKDSGIGIVQGVIGSILIKHHKNIAKETKRKGKKEKVIQMKPKRPKRAKTPVDAFLYLSKSATGRLYLTWQYGLTEEQRKAWEEYSIKNPLKNDFGDKYTIPGVSMFLLKNKLAKMFGLPILLEPPQDNFVQPLESFQVYLNSLQRSVQVSFSPSPLPKNHFLVLQSTGWIGKTKSNWLNLLRIVKIFKREEESPQEIGSTYIKRFGIFPAGTKHAFRAYLLNIENMAESNWIDFETLAC